MKCNLDSRGKAIRMVSGMACVVVGLVLSGLALGQFGPFWLLLGLGLGTLAGGLFQIYEGWKGWCVLRAMGWKTPV